MFKKTRLAYAVMGTFISPLCLAASDINFHGTLIELTCKIGNDKPIEVDFGDQVVTDLIDGQHYMQDVMLQIMCNHDYKSDLDFTIKGTAISFDKSALETDAADVGVRILFARDNSPVEINKAYVYRHRDDVSLKVVPVKKSGSAPKGGEFQASAQLLVEPQ